MMSVRPNTRKGFNLVETIAASVILSGLTLAVVARSTQCLNYTRINRHYERAAALADKQLSLIDYMGIDEFIEQGQMEGDFTDFEPGYHWEASTSYEDIDNLYLVSITVSWAERRRPYSIVIETKLNGEGTYTTTSDEESGTGTGTETGSE